MFDVSIINVGIDLDLATVIITMQDPKYLPYLQIFGKVSRVCSNHFLFILISDIVSMKITMLIVWALPSLDASRLIDTEQFVSQSVPPFVRVVQECKYEWFGFWIFLAYDISILLALIMVLLAILKKKIKWGDYKDSKKINILVVLYFLMPGLLRLCGFYSEALLPILQAS